MYKRPFSIYQPLQTGGDHVATRGAAARARATSGKIEQSQQGLWRRRTPQQGSEPHAETNDVLEVAGGPVSHRNGELALERHAGSIGVSHSGNALNGGSSNSLGLPEQSSPMDLSIVKPSFFPSPTAVQLKEGGSCVLGKCSPNAVLERTKDNVTCILMQCNPNAIKRLVDEGYLKDYLTKDDKLNFHIERVLETRNPNAIQVLIDENHLEGYLTKDNGLSYRIETVLTSHNPNAIQFLIDENHLEGYLTKDNGLSSRIEMVLTTRNSNAIQFLIDENHLKGYLTKGNGLSFRIRAVLMTRNPNAIQFLIDENHLKGYLEDESRLGRAELEARVGVIIKTCNSEVIHKMLCDPDRLKQYLCPNGVELDQSRISQIESSSNRKLKEVCECAVKELSAMLSRPGLSLSARWGVDQLLSKPEKQVIRVIDLENEVSPAKRKRA